MFYSHSIRHQNIFQAFSQKDINFNTNMSKKVFWHIFVQCKCCKRCAELKSSNHHWICTVQSQIQITVVRSEQCLNQFGLKVAIIQSKKMQKRYAAVQYNIIRLYPQRIKIFVRNGIASDCNICTASLFNINQSRVKQYI